MVERDDVRHSAETNDFNAFFAALGASQLESMEVEMPSVLAAIQNDPTAVGIVCTSYVTSGNMQSTRGWGRELG